MGGEKGQWDKGVALATDLPTTMAQALPTTTTGASRLQDNKIVCALVNCFKFRHVANASVYITINIYTYIYIVAIIT